MSLRSRQHPASARTSLLGYDVGTSFAGGGTSATSVVHPLTGHNAAAAGGRAADEMLLQDHNDQKIGELERQVGAIKHITLEIESELQHGNRMLDEMNFTMDNTRALLEGAMKRLEQVTAAAGSRHMVYLFMFCFFVFGLLYYLIR